MTHKKTWLWLLAGASLLAVSTMHWAHGAFTHDSFAYLLTAEHFQGQGDVFDVRRISLFTYFLMPFTGSVALLYLALAGAALAAFVVISRIVDFFKPDSIWYFLLFIIPSYMTSILTSILQESLALLLLSSAVLFVLKKKPVPAALFTALCVFTRPAMLAFCPGLVLAFVYRLHLYEDVRDGRYSGRLILGRAGTMLRDGSLFSLMVLLFGTACAALLLPLTPDPLVAFNALSGLYISDSLMRWGWPALWFGFFGALLAPFVLCGYGALYKKCRAAFVLFSLLFVPYLLGVWYQANIRYAVFLILPLAVGFSLMPIRSWKPRFRAGLILAALVSGLYPFGPLVYYYDYARLERVLGLSAKPYIIFDSEYKKDQYDRLGRLLAAAVRSPEEQRLLDSYRDSAMLAYIRKHICPDKKIPAPGGGSGGKSHSALGWSGLWSGLRSLSCLSSQASNAARPSSLQYWP